MRSLLRAGAYAAAVVFFTTATAARPCLAEHWQKIGDRPDSLEQIYIGTDSIEQQDGFRIVLIRAVLPQPEVNSHNITLDTRIQRSAFDCDRKMVAGIQTFGFLNGKSVGHGPLAADWKTKIVPVGNSAFDQHVLSLACSLPVPGEKRVDAQSPSTQQSPPSLSSGEHLLFRLPKSFKLGYHSERIGTLSEYVPNGETVDDWTQMLTVQVFPNLKTPAQEFLNTIKKQWLTTCPETPKPPVFALPENGYDVLIMALKCPKLPSTGKPKNTLFRVFRGRDALYSLQYSWRTSISDEAMHALSQYIVCDTRDPAHPCPSSLTTSRGSDTPLFSGPKDGLIPAQAEDLGKRSIPEIKR